MPYGDGNNKRARHWPHSLLRAVVLFLVFSVEISGRELRPQIASPKKAALKLKPKNEQASSSGISIPHPPSRRSSSKRKRWLPGRPRKPDRKKKASRSGRIISKRDFAVLEALQKEYTDRQLSVRFRSERKRLQARTDRALSRLWPRGRYVFQNECALVFDPGLQKRRRPYYTFRVACAPPERTIRLRRGKEGHLRLLRTVRSSVLLKAKLRLVSHSLKRKRRSSVFRWKWEMEELSFANPYLEALYQKYHPRRLEQIRVPVRRASELPFFFSIAKARRTRQTPREAEKELSRYLPAGSFLSFDRDCPLRLSAPVQLPEQGLVRLRLEAACLSGKQRKVVVFVPKTSPNLPFFLDQRPGTLFQARLQFREILWEEHQFYPLWDTILKPEPLDRTEGLPLRYLQP